MKVSKIQLAVTRFFIAALIFNNYGAESEFLFFLGVANALYGGMLFMSGIYDIVFYNYIKTDIEKIKETYNVKFLND